jgi:hypothetical protein
MSAKTFKSRMAELSAEITRLRFHARPTQEAVQKVLVDVIFAMDEAGAVRDYQYLSNLMPYIRQLGVLCFKRINENDSNAGVFIEFFQVDSETYLDFVRDIYPSLTQPQADILLGKMIDNLIVHETYYQAARPRLAEELLAATLVNTKSARHAIQLCDAVCQVNNNELSGINAVVRALHGNQSGMDNAVLQSTLQWIRGQDFELATAIKDGGITDYVMQRSVESAADLGLPLVSANLAIRTDSFDFKCLAESYVLHGIVSDAKQVSYILNKSSKDVLSVAGMVAFSLVFNNILPEDMSEYSALELLTVAASEIQELQLNINPETASEVLPPLVEQIPATADISGLDASILSPYLRKIRKFNGMRLEGALGL